MEMSQVRYFLAICEHGSFTKAAREAHVAQPSLTQAIKKLEDEFGGALFLRDRAGCSLTALGHLVRPRLETIAAETDAAKAAAVRHVRLDRVPIRIGVAETIGPTRLAADVGRFQAAEPNVDIEFLIKPVSDLEIRLRSGDIDVLVTSKTDWSPELYKVEAAYRERYLAVIPRDQASTAPNEAFDLAMLAERPFLDRPNCEMRETLQAICAERGVPDYAAYRSNSELWLLSLASQGVGVAILPEFSLGAATDAVRRLPIKDLDLARTVNLVRYRQQPSRPETSRLISRIAG